MREGRERVPEGKRPLHRWLWLMGVMLACGVAYAATGGGQAGAGPATAVISGKWQQTRYGWQILRPFPAAPYPDPSRAQGHTYDGKLYGPGHYQDSRVGIFIPDGYHPSKRGINFIVHYHGWNNHVSRVLLYYRLPQQVEESRVQAVLVVPQGPEDAPDSDDGKITHDPGDVARLLNEVARFLVQSGKAPTARIGRIAISTHSGGQQPVVKVLFRSGQHHGTRSGRGFRTSPVGGFGVSPQAATGPRASRSKSAG